MFHCAFGAIHAPAHKRPERRLLSVVLSFLSSKCELPRRQRRSGGGSLSAIRSVGETTEANDIAISG